MNQISTRELYAQLENPDLKLIDIRSIDAYNGWKLNHEARGGHIKGSRSLPFKWLNYIDWIEIVRSKDILPHHPLVVYGYDKYEIEKVASAFIRTGYQDVSVYFSFIDEWSAKKDFPLEKLARYRHLVSPNWLNDLILNGKAPVRNSMRWLP